MPRITMNRAFIAHWRRKPHPIGRLSASAQSHHSLSSAAFITNIAESDFRHAQEFPRKGLASNQFSGDPRSGSFGEHRAPVPEPHGRVAHLPLDRAPL